MKFIDQVQTAQSNLLRSKTRTFLTVLAVLIGTFTLSMTTALGQGMRQFIDQQLHAEAQPDTVQITLKANASGPRSSNGIAVYDPNHAKAIGRKVSYMNPTDVANIQKTPHISNVYPNYSLATDYIQYGNGTKYVFGIQTLFPHTSLDLSAGNSFDEHNTDSLILPYPYIETLGFASAQDAVGKTVHLQFTQETLGNQTGATKTLDLKIAGVGIDSLHSQNGFISPDLTQQLASWQQNNNPQFSSVLATTTHLTTTEATEMKNKLDAQGYDGTTYEDIVAQFSKSIRIAIVGLDGFAIVALLAATLGIVNTLLMAVFERTQEIGLLKALGMRRAGIFSIFVMEALSIGFWGGIIGVVLALMSGRIANHILLKTIFIGLKNTNILTFPPLYMAGIVVGAMIVGLLAGVIPAIRASRLDPINALRTE